MIICSAALSEVDMVGEIRCCYVLLLFVAVTSITTVQHDETPEDLAGQNTDVNVVPTLHINVLARTTSDSVT